MTEQELIDNYNRLLKENDELKEEINVLKSVECPLEKDFLGYMNCEYPKQGPTMPCHNRIREMIEEHNNQIEAYKEILETRREHEARADERYSELKEENKRLRAFLERISIGMDVRPFNATAAQVEAYFKNIAEEALKGEIK